MKKLNELTFNNLLELVDYLKILSQKETLEEQINFVEDRLGGFFPNLNANQELELFYIVNNKDEVAFNIFKEQNKDMDVDETGMSQPSQKNYWEIKEKALESIYSAALEKLEKRDFKDSSKHRIHTQVYWAKNLNCFKNIKIENISPLVSYSYRKKVFLNKFLNDPILNEFTINKIEKHLTSFNIDYKKFFELFFKFVENKKRDNFILFTEHLFKRIELMSSDKDLISVNNKQFKDNLENVIK
jgi:hypothetical protein